MNRSHSMLILPAVASDERAAVEAHVDANAGIWPAVPAPELPAGLTEVDARALGVNTGRVALYLCLCAGSQHYVVQVESARGEPLARITAETRLDALDVYHHPFARPDVPDIFGEAA